MRTHTHVPRWACGANHTETVFGLYRVRRMCRSRPLAHRRPPCSRALTVTHRPSPAAGRSSAGRVRRTAPGRRSVLLLQRRAWARLRRGRRGLCVVPYSRVGARRDLAKCEPRRSPRSCTLAVCREGHAGGTAAPTRGGPSACGDCRVSRRHRGPTALGDTGPGRSEPGRWRRLLPAGSGTIQKAR